MSLRVTVCGKVNPCGVAVAKASLNRANESHAVDPNGNESLREQTNPEEGASRTLTVSKVRGLMDGEFEVGRRHKA